MAAVSPFDPIFKTRDGLDESFYVPAFRVESGKDQAALQPLFNVQSVSCQETVNQLGSFDLTVDAGDWAPKSGRYLILPGHYVRVWMGYQGPIGLYVMVTGRVSSVTANFAESGARTLKVRGVSGFDKLRDKPDAQNRRSGRNRQPPIKYSKLVENVAGPYNAIPLIPASVKSSEPAAERAAQNNETDMAFLVRLAQRRGYVVVFREFLAPPPPGAAGGRHSSSEPKRFIYFGPSNLLDQATLTTMGDRPQRVQLKWGFSLNDFRPVINVSSSLWKEVTVSFWDRKTKKRTPLKYDLDQLWTDEHDLNHDLFDATRNSAGFSAPRDQMAKSDASDTPVDTREEAIDLARARLRENFLQMVTAEGTTVGLPELRAASKVEVAGTGLLDGTYFLTSVTHTLDDRGYETQFSARREKTS
jgi:Bacteriophage probable baseplate hub protein